MWREAKNLRRWIVQEKQRIANEISEKQKEQEEQQKAAMAVITSSAVTSEVAAVVVSTTSTVSISTPQKVDRTTYEYFRDIIVAKLRVLFDILPASASSGNRSSAVILAAVSGTACLQFFLIANLILTVVKDYVKCAPDKASIPSILRRREARARGRADAMRTTHDLLQTLHLLSAKQDVLRISGHALRYWQCCFPLRHELSIVDVLQIYP